MLTIDKQSDTSCCKMTYCGYGTIIEGGMGKSY